jgi:hypothetical protein
MKCSATLIGEVAERYNIPEAFSRLSSLWVLRVDSARYLLTLIMRCHARDAPWGH